MYNLQIPIIPITITQSSCFDSPIQANPLQGPTSGLNQGRISIRTGSVDHPIRLAVFISGSGSGMDALIRHQRSFACLHQTRLVVSNQPDVAGLTKAEDYGIATVTIEIDRTISESKLRREQHEIRIMEALSEHEIEAVILSGYMRILSPLFIQNWKGRLLNIHPSLLPKYPGANAHRDALADGAKVTGCTVHFVDEGVDTGPILAQREIAILADDDEESLSERVKKLEHQLYPEVIDAFVEGQFEYD